ncbi:MAG: response regulator [Chitinophagaceae bacterium]|nr:MAG: response regulator [Chitinophagaceae bacterium]
MQAKGKKILIVDDDNRNIFALSAVLKAKGHVCLSAPGVSEAVDIIRSDSGIGIILLDMMMPDMDGYEAIPRIRVMEEGHDLPIIAVTAQAMKGDRERCLEAGANDYIAKPVNIDALEKILSLYIG